MSSTDNPPTVPSTTDQPATQASHTNNKTNNGNSKKGNEKKNEAKKGFKGATSAFQDKVFATKTENPSSSYRDTLDMARTYAATSYSENSKRFASLFEAKPMNPSVSLPDELEGNDRTDQVLVSMYIDDRRRAIATREKLTNHLFSFFEVLLGQCSTGVRSKLSGHPDFDRMRSTGDCASLLEAIRQIMFEYRSLPSMMDILKCIAPSRTIVLYQKYSKMALTSFIAPLIEWSQISSRNLSKEVYFGE